MRTSLRTVSGGKRAEVLHIQPLDQLLVNADLQLLEIDLPLGLRRRLRADGDDRLGEHRPV